MKHIGKYAGVLAILAVPAVTFAQLIYTPSDTIQALIDIEDNSKLLEMVSLSSTLIVALVTSAMVLIGGNKMHGGVFGKVLYFFGAGMALIFLGLATELPFLQNIDQLYLKMAKDTLYITGYILMGLAASKLLRAIKGE